ncbi:hypothetical protein [Acetobacter fabarum]|uniref:hypothetical protein n=1 Tax=Acetobacter fabarum TaxID=483199 RepID=UPI00117779DC|nr:hypothetical protein [Acetobacter fabarum]
MPQLTLTFLSNGQEIQDMSVTPFNATEIEGGCVIAKHNNTQGERNFIDLDTVRIKWADGSCPEWEKDFSVIIPGDTGNSVYRFRRGATLTVVFRPQEQVLVVERDSQSVNAMRRLIDEINNSLSSAPTA